MFAARAIVEGPWFTGRSVPARRRAAAGSRWTRCGSASSRASDLHPGRVNAVESPGGQLGHEAPAGPGGDREDVVTVAASSPLRTGRTGR